MDSLEAVLRHGTARVKSAFEEAQNEAIGMLKENRTGILAGFAYGVASRLFFNVHIGALPAMLTPLATYARKYGLSKKLDSAGISAGGYIAGYALTELALRAVFSEFLQQLPAMPPQPPLPDLPAQPSLPRIFSL